MKKGKEKGTTVDAVHTVELQEFDRFRQKERDFQNAKKQMEDQQEERVRQEAQHDDRSRQEVQTKKQIEDQQDERFKKLINEAFAIQAASQPYRPGDRADQEELERFRKEKEAQTSKEQQDALIKKAVAEALAAQQPQQGGGSSNGSQRKSRPYQARNARRAPDVQV